MQIVQMSNKEAQEAADTEEDSAHVAESLDEGQLTADESDRPPTELRYCISLAYMA